MKTVTVKKGSTVESNFGTKHEVLADFKATVLDRQHVEPLEPYFICLNDGKFESGLEEPFADLGQGQAFFVNERDVEDDYQPLKDGQKTGWEVKFGGRFGLGFTRVSNFK